MIFRSAVASADDFASATGWHLRPEGLCREERCVPFATRDPGTIPLADAARAHGMPIVHDATHSIWALGAESGGHALVTAKAPDLELPDATGRPFRLASLRGQKVLLVAWASW